ncbi:MAG: inositol monophosphatase [Marinilabiliaceae bacterium]|nr:inositol monophosphatase [Marinilabiliaceae bacterium]
MKFNLESLCHNAVKIATQTGKDLRETRSSINPDFKSKGYNDFVTKFDLETETKLVKELKQILPEAGFIVEESSIQMENCEYCWIIDPIDGTTNFIHGLFPYAISIALMKHNIIVLGVVYEIGLDECFYAWENSSAMLNGNEINVSTVNRVADSLIATGFPYTNFSKIDKYMESLQYFMKQSHGLRRLGSAAVDLAYVACGRLDAFYEYDLKPWDVAAGTFIVQQAGGKNSDFSGGNNYLFGKEIISTNGVIHTEFLRETQYFLK